MDQKALWKKRIVIIFGVVLLFVGAYFFGSRVMAPMRAASLQQQQSMANGDEAAEAETAIPAAPVAAVAASLASGSARNGESVPTSFFLTDVQYLNLDDTIERMHACKIDTLTVPLVWSMLEPEKGQITTDAYWDRLDALAEEGFSFVFVLDASSRSIYDEQAVQVGYSIPDWVYRESDSTAMLDFTGGTGSARGAFSFSYPDNQRLYLDFCDRTIEAFGGRYKDSVLGFAPGIMPELEVKYPQENLAWTDYNEAAQDHFRGFVKEKYGTVQAMNEKLGTGCLSFGEVVLPVVNYNNSIASGQLDEHPLFADYQEFRESELLQYLIPVYDLIHEKGYKTFSYFGQVLHPHDGICATGIATKLQRYVDVAVIDYKFHDGYGPVLDGVIPAMMVNYVKSAGYDSVWAGFNAEQLINAGIEDYGFLQEALDYVAADGRADGVEISGLQHSIKASGDGSAGIDLACGSVRRTTPAKIAIYASEWNFYRSHGESQAFIHYFSDCVAQMYKIMRFEMDMDVDILCDEAVLGRGLGQYDLLVIPGQFYVADAVREAIEAYMKGGGRVLQDFRFGEWNEYGQNTGSWSDGYFDIAAREALHQEETVEVVDPDFQGIGSVAFTAPYALIPNVYAIAGSSEDSRYLFRDEAGKYYGTRTDHTICLCWQPQVQYKYAETEEERQACVQVIKTAVEALLNIQKTDQ